MSGMDGVEWNGRSGMEWTEWNGMDGVEWNGMAEWSGMDGVEWTEWNGRSGMDGVEWTEWNGRSGIGMGWRSGMGLRSPERVGKTSETSENVGGGLNEIWYMTEFANKTLE